MATHTSKTRQFQIYMSPLASFVQAGMLGLLVFLLYVGICYWNTGPDDVTGWRAVDVLGPDRVPKRFVVLRAKSASFAFAGKVTGELPTPYQLSLYIDSPGGVRRVDDETVLLVSLERDTRVADLAPALDVARRAGINEGAFLVRKTFGYSILFEQRTRTIRFPLTQGLGRRLRRGGGQKHGELSNPCGVLEVMGDEEIGNEAPFDRLARAMVRCRERFPHI